MLLIYPPVSKASEPPIGISLLVGALKAHGVSCSVLDMNLGVQDYLLDQSYVKHKSKKHYREQLQKIETYQNRDRYQRAIQEVSKSLNDSNPRGIEITLANYSDRNRDPLRSKDLIQAAIDHQHSPFYSYYKETLTEYLKKNNPRAIGISLQYIQQALPVFALIGTIRELSPKTPILLGGGLITSWSVLPNWKNPFSQWVDKIISGPGEEPLLNFLGVEPDCEKLKKTQPCFQWTKELNYYAPHRIIPITGSLGCSWNRCRFCPERAEGASYQHKKSTLILQQIESLEQEFNPGLLHFLDNEISPDLLRALSRRENATPWYGFTRFYPMLLDPDFCHALKQGGCTMLKLGLESGDKEVLESMDKGIDLAHVPVILKNLKEAGIGTYLYLLFGTPGENHESARRTMEFIESHHPWIDYLNNAIFNLPVVGEGYIGLERYNFSDADLSLYQGFKHPQGWDRIHVRKFLKKEFSRKPGIRKILQRLPAQFNANHAPFFSH